MITHDDFREFLRLLHEHDVECVVLGGYAVAYHGYVRNTQDLDILFRNDEHSVMRLLEVLTAFGFPRGTVDAATLAEPWNAIRIGLPPVRIELFNHVSGPSFEEIWESKVRGHYGDVPVYYIGRDELIRNKTASGRPRDMADVAELAPGDTEADGTKENP